MRTNHDQTRTKQHLSSPIRRSLLQSSFPLSTAVLQRLSSRDASFNQHKVTAAACCGNISVLDIPRGRRKCSHTPCEGRASAWTMFHSQWHRTCRKKKKKQKTWAALNKCVFSQSRRGTGCTRNPVVPSDSFAWISGVCGGEAGWRGVLMLGLLLILVRYLCHRENTVLHVC